MFNKQREKNILIVPFESGFGVEFVWIVRNKWFVNYLLFEGENFK
jgi:hypothetical protein